MAIFSGKASKSKSKSESTTNASKKLTSSTKSKKDTTSAQDTTQQQTTLTLGNETQGILQQAIADVASGSVAAEDLNSFVLDLQDRAGGAQDAINAETEAFLSEARRSGEKAIGRSVTELAASTGSSQNSFVQQIALESQTGLESQLAALGSEFALKARDTQTQEFQQVLQGLQSGVSSESAQSASLSQLSGILKGATTSTTGTTATTAKAAENTSISRLVDELIKSQTKSKSKGKEGSLGFEFGG